MTFVKKLHFLHRAYRYRFRSEPFGIKFVRDRLSPGDTAIDIGANRGLFSYWMSKSIGPSGKLVAFEPQPELQETLASVKGEFSLTNLEVVPAGLSDEIGQFTLKRPMQNWGGASLEKRGSQELGYEEFDVSVTTLDLFAEQHGLANVSLIKCDVEGHELKVFRGGEQLLKTNRPAILFECDDPNVPDCDVFHYLESIGYKGFCFHEGLTPVEQIPGLGDRLDPKAAKDFAFLPADQVQA